MPAVQQVAKVNRELQRLGLGKLSDPKLFDQMAFLVRDHDHFRGLLMHEEPSVRAQMYQCLGPRLRFKAKPLEDYEAESKRIAEEKQLPQYVPETLECREIRPYHMKSEEFKAEEQSRREAERFVGSMREPKRKNRCALCAADDPITTGAPVQYHNWKPEDGGSTKIACCDSEFIPSGCPVSERLPDATVNLRVSQQRSVLDDAAEREIARSLREEDDKYQLHLVCAVCTFEQRIRVKRKPAAYKVAKQYGWTFPEKDKALCFACSKKRVN
jgi:hypothetical protein